MFGLYGQQQSKEWLRNVESIDIVNCYCEN